MRVQSKSELKQELDELRAHIIKMAERAERAERAEWERRTPEATAEFYKQIKAIFPNSLYNARFEHVDASGYWFSFELINDPRRQTYAVRHKEVIK